jgi:hypothetical protein
VVHTNTPTPTSSVRCTQEIHDSTARYDFVNAGSGDAPAADPTNPIAWLAPVWTGR